jgi:hypothetical protein
MKDTVGGRWMRAAAMKSGALKISKPFDRLRAPSGVEGFRLVV